MPSTVDVGLDPERSYEFVNGVPVEKEISGIRHNRVKSRLSIKLGNFVEENKLGEVYSEASFQLGVNERIPDLAFVAADRMPPEGEPETKWLIVPDLAVEVISPTDYYEKVHSKAMEFLAAGVKVVWIVSPENQTITTYRSATNVMAFPYEADLVCEDLLPGFRCPLREIFKNPAGK